MGITKLSWKYGVVIGCGGGTAYRCIRDGLLGLENIVLYFYTCGHLYLHSLVVVFDGRA